jgi:uncharacterized protein (TIGR02145 family)
MKIKPLLHLTLFVLLVITCEKEKPEPPQGFINKISIATSDAEQISYRSANIGGTLGDTHGQTIQDYGHCWDTLQNPDISKSKRSNDPFNGSIKTFTSQLSDLIPSKQYFVRAYFTVDEIVVYSTAITFNTKKPAVPVVITVVVSDITATAAASGGTVTDDGGYMVTARGVCWSTSPNPTIADSKTINGTDIGDFNSNLSSLSVNTKYYVRAYAINSAGNGYGNEISFTTKDGLPVLTTTLVSNITATTAISGGTITEDWGFPVTEKGVCWSTSQNPTVTDYTATNGADAGAFSSNITGFNPNTTYYVRAYATNSIGTGYGNQVNFKYNPSSGTFTDIREGGHVYKFVTIGSQLWMAENLAYLPSVSPPSSGSTTSPYYYVYGYEGTSLISAKATSNYSTYGVLYNWSAAMDGASSSSSNPSGVQGVCPSGWHLPSDAEWTELTDFLDGEGVAGGKLKEAGYDHWYSPNTDATDEKGFTALPGGYRDLGGSFINIGYDGSWWSGTEYDATIAWYRFMSYDIAGVDRYNYYREVGFSVRCVRDY